MSFRVKIESFGCLGFVMHVISACTCKKDLKLWHFGKDE